MNLSETLSAALAVRLNLQISVSSLPVVEEAMDAPIGRWIDSAPLPPESADGQDARFRVRVASDLGGVGFAMDGLPGAVIPKLGNYLRQSGLGPAEEKVIDALGGALEPPRVGSFVHVAGGRLITGWLFPTRLPLDAIEAHVPGVAGSPAAAWLRERGIGELAGLWHAVGGPVASDLWIALPGTSPDATVGAAAELFAALGGGELPGPVRDAALAGEPPRIVARIGGPAPRVALSIGGAGLAALQAIAAACGRAVDPGVAPLIATLGARDLEAVEYAVAGGAPQVLGVIAPSGAERDRAGHGAN
jgi:hypothetical protein